MAIKIFMEFGHESVYLGILIKEKCKLQLKHIWYPMVLSFINEYGKDMIPFDLKWIIMLC